MLSFLRVAWGDAAGALQVISRVAFRASVSSLPSECQGVRGWREQSWAPGRSSDITRGSLGQVPPGPSRSQLLGQQEGGPGGGRAASSSGHSSSGPLLWCPGLGREPTGPAPTRHESDRKQKLLGSSPGEVRQNRLCYFGTRLIPLHLLCLWAPTPPPLVFHPAFLKGQPGWDPTSPSRVCRGH